MPDFGTRPKPGAPATFNIGIEILGEMLSPTPVYWLAPLLASFQPITESTAALCAEPPPPPESWTVADLWRYLDPAQSAFETDKLIRLAHAGIWTTYCEFYPLEGQGDMLGTPIYGGYDSLGWGITTGNTSAYSNEIRGHPARGIVTGVMTTDDVWFWTQIRVCIEQSAENGYPNMYHADDAGNLLNALPNYGWPIYPGESTIALFLPSNVLSVPSTNGDRWAYQPPVSGIWGSKIDIWRRAIPPTPQPWPAAPPVPSSFQFSDEVAAQLATMSGEWSAHRIAGALVPGMLSEIGEHVDELQASSATVAANLSTILEELAARGLDAAALALEVEKILVKLYEYRPEETSLLGPATEFSGHIALDELPDDCRGVLIEVDVPAEWGTIGEYIPIAWDLGYVAWTRSDAFYPSERIKHPAQFFVLEHAAGSFPYDATGIRVELREPLGGRYSWLVRNPPPARVP